MSIVIKIPIDSNPTTCKLAECFQGLEKFMQKVVEPLQEIGKVMQNASKEFDKSFGPQLKQFQESYNVSYKSSFEKFVEDLDKSPGPLLKQFQELNKTPFKLLPEIQLAKTWPFPTLQSSNLIHTLHNSKRKSHTPTLQYIIRDASQYPMYR